MYVGWVSIFYDLFNPNNRNRTEELRRLENTREEEAQGERGRGPIDLTSGTVLIRPPARKPEAAPAGEEPEGAAGPHDEGEPHSEDAAAPVEGDSGA